jgi:hypothetical protein
MSAANGRQAACDYSSAGRHRVPPGTRVKIITRQTGGFRIGRRYQSDVAADGRETADRRHQRKSR